LETLESALDKEVSRLFIELDPRKVFDTITWQNTKLVHNNLTKYERSLDIFIKFQKLMCFCIKSDNLFEVFEYTYKNNLTKWNDIIYESIKSKFPEFIDRLNWLKMVL
jgi:hypothetical protein